MMPNNCSCFVVQESNLSLQLRITITIANANIQFDQSCHPSILCERNTKLGLDSDLPNKAVEHKSISPRLDSDASLESRQQMRSFTRKLHLVKHS